MWQHNGARRVMTGVWAWGEDAANRASRETVRRLR